MDFEFRVGWGASVIMFLRVCRLRRICTVLIVKARALVAQNLVCNTRVPKRSYCVKINAIGMTVNIIFAFIKTLIKLDWHGSCEKSPPDPSCSSPFFQKNITVWLKTLACTNKLLITNKNHAFRFTGWSIGYSRLPRFVQLCGSICVTGPLI